MTVPLTFRLLEDDYVVARLDPATAVDSAWLQGEFWTISRSAEELSVTTSERYAPRDGSVESGWRALQLRGPIPFETTGVAASFTAPLAERGISVFVISTYDTDYLLVKEPDLENAIAALRAAEFVIERDPSPKRRADL